MVEVDVLDEEEVVAGTTLLVDVVATTEVELVVVVTVVDALDELPLLGTTTAAADAVTVTLDELVDPGATTATGVTSSRSVDVDVEVWTGSAVFAIREESMADRMPKRSVVVPVSSEFVVCVLGSIVMVTTEPLPFVTVVSCAEVRDLWWRRRRRRATEGERERGRFIVVGFERWPSRIGEGGMGWVVANCGSTALCVCVCARARVVSVRV